MKSRRPNKIESFEKLKQMGVPVETVLDVGILTCTSELMRCFPDKPHILMEPIVEFEDRIRAIYDKAGISYELVQAAMSDEDGTVTLKTMSVREETNITHARITDTQGEGSNFREMPSIKLDTLVAQRNLKGPYLLKIDVDGAEPQILAGGKNMLSDCSIVCVEAGVKTFIERANMIIAAGFQFFDVVDLCYYDGRLVQTDMIFLNEKIVQQHNLEVYRDGFDIHKWQPYQPT